jgi:hypothetical protein
MRNAFPRRSLWPPRPDDWIDDAAPAAEAEAPRAPVHRASAQLPPSNLPHTREEEMHARHANTPAHAHTHARPNAPKVKPSAEKSSAVSRALAAIGAQVWEQERTRDPRGVAPYDACSRGRGSRPTRPPTPETAHMREYEEYCSTAGYTSTHSGHTSRSGFRSASGTTASGVGKGRSEHSAASALFEARLCKPLGQGSAKQGEKASSSGRVASSGTSGMMVDFGLSDCEGEVPRPTRGVGHSHGLAGAGALKFLSL